MVLRATRSRIAAVRQRAGAAAWRRFSSKEPAFAAAAPWSRPDLGLGDDHLDQRLVLAGVGVVRVQERGQRPGRHREQCGDEQNSATTHEDLSRYDHDVRGSADTRGVEIGPPAGVITLTMTPHVR
jgi:hypothetical protein